MLELLELLDVDEAGSSAGIRGSRPDEGRRVWGEGARGEGMSPKV